MQDTRILTALSSQKWFIVWKFVPNPERAKPDKVPIWPHTGHACNWMDPAARMLPHEALAWAQHLGPGHGVGLVLTPGCGLLAIDLDHARNPAGGWFPHVAAFEAQFHGAYLETSISGAGRHIVARVVSALLPAHGTRNADFRAEAYSQDRFIALTGLNASGGLEQDHTPVGQRFLAHYFPPPDSSRSGEWRDGPVEAWSGPADDEEIIRLAGRSASPRAIWGSRAAFSDLWAGHVEVLSRVFPPQSIGQAYDASAADQALANHLAFWTGNDCPRMERLIKASGLRRIKHDRPDYMRRTILAACASQREWYSGGRFAQENINPGAGAVQEPPLQPASVQAVTSIAGPETFQSTTQVSGLALRPGEFPAPGTYFNIILAKQHFAGCVYVQDIDRIQQPDGTLCNKQQFDNWRGHWEWPIEPDGSKPSKSAWDSFLYNKMHQFPRVRSQYFGPRDPIGYVRINEDNTTEINSYVPLNIRRVEGDPTPFIQHVQRLLPYDWELMIYTLAARVQYQGVKFTWAPFLQGTKGNGKTLLAKILEYCIGKRYVHWPKADQLDEKFNAMLVRTILIIVDEMEKFPMEIEPILNSLVTCTRLEIRAMQQDKVMRDVCFNSMFISNDQTSLRCDPDQRRYAPFFCAQQHKADLARDGLTSEYFIRFRRWLENEDGFAITAHYLHDLRLPDSARPDIAIRAPDTSSTVQAYGASRTAAEQEIINAIEQQREGFRNGWISSHAVDMEFARSGRARSMSLNARRAIVEGLGYRLHPSLHDGLCTIALPDGNKPRLYIREEHPWAIAGLTVDQVRAGYLEAQRV